MQKSQSFSVFNVLSLMLYILTSIQVLGTAFAEKNVSYMQKWRYWMYIEYVFFFCSAFLRDFSLWLDWLSGDASDTWRGPAM